MFSACTYSRKLFLQVLLLFLLIMSFLLHTSVSERIRILYVLVGWTPSPGWRRDSSCSRRTGLLQVLLGWTPSKGWRDSSSSRRTGLLLIKHKALHLHLDIKKAIEILLEQIKEGINNVLG